jgi:hypothetical protein
VATHFNKFSSDSIKLAKSLDSTEGMASLLTAGVGAGTTTTAATGFEENLLLRIKKDINAP